MMKKTYITTMPDKAGAFLKACRVIGRYGGNIVRVNYNKAVDIHTLFIEVSAEDTAHLQIEEALAGIGYLRQELSPAQVLLIVLRLRDVVGAVAPILEELTRQNVSISYMNSQEDGSGYQNYKMGLLLENPQASKSVLDALSKLCEVRVVDYDVTEKALDGTVFYISFANDMRRLLSLDQQQTNEVIIQSNRIMQMLDAGHTPPMQTFEYIRKFAQFVVDHHGSAFRPRISRRAVTERMTMTILEPPCGSNTVILDDGEKLLFFDFGFSCYREEMLRELHELFPDFDKREKFLALTHGDIDHTGFPDIFGHVYMTRSCYENFRLEQAGRPNFREQYPPHLPYCYLSKVITGYRPPCLDGAVILGEKTDSLPLSPVGTLAFGELRFEVLEGSGGHVRGETVYVEHTKKLVFTGDILVNIHGFTIEQDAFNRLAPYLMSSVNVDSAKARESRKLILERYRGYTYFPAHGAPMEAESK